MIGIAEILINPRYQGRGYAAALLHINLKYYAAQGARVMLDAFEGSSVNRWYESLGFQEEEPSGKLELDARHALSTRYMVTPRSITAAGIVRQLETRHPVLRSSSQVI